MLKPQRKKRKTRIRSKISGTADVPRLAVYRSNKFTYAQIIDDSKHATLVSVSGIAASKKGTKSDIASELGRSLAILAKKKGIKKVVFDRAGYAYHGRIKSLAEAAKQEGLIF